MNTTTDGKTSVVLLEYVIVFSNGAWLAGHLLAALKGEEIA